MKLVGDYAELVHIEELGFFNLGEVFKAVAEGATRLDGPKPINTSGGSNVKVILKGRPVFRSYMKFGHS